MEKMESQERFETSCQFKIQINTAKYPEEFKRDLQSLQRHSLEQQRLPTTTLDTLTDNGKDSPTHQLWSSRGW
jgi:hypothetical protein